MSARVVRFGTGRAGHSGKSPFAHIKKIERHGLIFASKKEADRWDALLLMLQANRIRNLRRQVPYKLEVNGILIKKYTADHVYEELWHGIWVEVTEDVKGWPNERWPMTKKLFRAIFGREIREV